MTRKRYACPGLRDAKRTYAAMRELASVYIRSDLHLAARNDDMPDNAPPHSWFDGGHPRFTRAVTRMVERHADVLREQACALRELRT